MANRHGDFVWYELMTSNADAAQQFYSGMLGWNFSNPDPDEHGYRTFAAKGQEVGGLLPISDEMAEQGARPAWLGYVRVDDLETAKQEFTDAGGAVQFAAEVPEVGPFALVSDPQGVMLYLIEDRSGKESHAFSTHEQKPGHCAWNELLTEDAEAATSFYNAQFGWVVADSMDIEGVGTYDMMKNGEDRDFIFGGLMKRPPEMPVSAWNFYFRVPDIDAAHDYILNNGGQPFGEPMAVPGDDFCINGTDPQGAMFAVVGKRGA